MAYTLPEGLTEFERRIFVYYLFIAQQDGIIAVTADQLACAQADEIDRTGVGIFRSFRFAVAATERQMTEVGRIR